VGRGRAVVYHAKGEDVRLGGIDRVIREGLGRQPIERADARVHQVLAREELREPKVCKASE
jgi:hypothetical protein